MFKTSKFAALAILGALAINPAFAENKSAALVNGVSIPQSRIDLRVNIAASQGQPDSPELRKAIREDTINLEVMAQEAAKLGLNKNEEVIQQIELAKQSVLAGALMQNFAKNHPIGDSQLKQEYDKLKTKLGNKEYSVRHILVDTKDEAKAIIGQLDKKEKFEKLAEKSRDAGSIASGGSLGWTVPNNFVQPFASALLKLKKGEYTSEPIQTQYGWHVIRLDDIRDLKAPPFEEVKPQLQERLQQQAIQKEIGDLRAKSKIE